MTKQHPNAFAYVIYERSQAEPGKWIRSVMFYANDPAHSDRAAVWDYNVGWRDPKKIRVVPLFDEDGNDAMREDNLEAVSARYQAETAAENKSASLASAVEKALETNLPMERFEGLLRTLQAFETQVQDQLQVPPNTVQRADYLPSVEQLEALGKFNKG